jgi:hypothetical protein
MNDSKRPMSSLGRSLFDMMNALNRTYITGIDVEAHDRAIYLHKPIITKTIKRSSRKVRS